MSEIVSEYDQEIPQLQTTDKPVASCGRATQQSRDTKKTNKAKDPALSSPSRLMLFLLNICRTWPFNSMKSAAAEHSQILRQFKFTQS